MSTPVLTFFNCKGGVWKTSLVYHVASMLPKMDGNVPPNPGQVAKRDFPSTDPLSGEGLG